MEVTELQCKNYYVRAKKSWTVTVNFTVWYRIKRCIKDVTTLLVNANDFHCKIFSQCTEGKAARERCFIKLRNCKLVYPAPADDFKFTTKRPDETKNYRTHK